jgi:protoporphyrinogen oxidase
MGFTYQGKLYPFGTPRQLLAFTPLPFWERIWFGVQALYLGKVEAWEKYEAITAHDWMKRYSGPSIWRVVWEPLLKGKFGRFYDKVAMAWLWARIHTRASSRKGAQEKLGYFQGGFEAFHKALAEAVQRQGAKVSLNSPIERVLVEGGRFKGVKVGGKDRAFDRLVFAAATPLFLRTCPGLPEDYVKRVTQLEFLGAQCLILVMKKAFSGLYWINIADADIPILALIEHTNFAPFDWYQGKHLMYVGNYLPQDHRYFKMGKEEILREILPHLKRINPSFDEAQVEEVHLHQDLYAQPVVPLHYSKVKPTYETPVEGAFLANMALVYPEDRGTNFAVDVGNKVAKLVDPSVEIPPFKG